MLKVATIKQIIKDAKASGYEDAKEADVIFLILCDQLAYKELAYKYAYATDDTKQAEAHFASDEMRAVKDAMLANGYEDDSDKDIKDDINNGLTKERNTQEYIRLIDRTEDAMRRKRITERDGLKLIGEYRKQLNDKFVGMEEENKEQRIVIVPQKHDYICPHTNRECYQWPSKEACMRKYNLIEQKN